MAFSKAHYFQPSDYYFSLICRALSHPARIVILSKLMRHRQLTVAQLRVGVPLSSQAFSQHLKVLREMMLVSGCQEAPTVTYSLNQDLVATRKLLLEMLKIPGSGIHPDMMKETADLSSQRAFAEA